MSMDPGGTLDPVVSNDPTVKPGYLTTEWWTTILTVVAGVVIALLALFGKKVDGSSLGPLIGALAILASGIAAAFYNHGRSTVKAAALHAAASSSGVYSISTLAEPIRSISATGMSAPPPPLPDGPPMAEDTGVGH